MEPPNVTIFLSHVLFGPHNGLISSKGFVGLVFSSSPLHNFCLPYGNAPRLSLFVFPFRTNSAKTSPCSVRIVFVDGLPAGVLCDTFPLLPRKLNSGAVRVLTCVQHVS